MLFTKSKLMEQAENSFCAIRKTNYSIAGMKSQSAETSYRSKCCRSEDYLLCADAAAEGLVVLDYEHGGFAADYKLLQLLS